MNAGGLFVSENGKTDLLQPHPSRSLPSCSFAESISRIASKWLLASNRDLKRKSARSLRNTAAEMKVSHSVSEVDIRSSRIVALWPAIQMWVKRRGI